MSLIAHLRGYTPLRADARRPYWILLAIPAAILFLYAPWSTSDVSGDGWEIIARHQSGARLSRGALQQQGARAHVRENLRHDRNYIFSPVGAGWNNQIFQIADLIYLAHLSERIPILPAFHWNSQHKEQDALVSEFFDLSQVSTYLGLPIVEMHELRLSTSSPERAKLVTFDGEFEQYNHIGSVYKPGDKVYAEPMEDDSVGCWSMHESHGNRADESAYSLYHIHTPYTPVPHSAYMWDDDPNRPGFHQTARIIREHREEPPAESVQIIEASNSIPTPEFWPDRHLTCLDTTFGMVEQLGRYDMGAECRLGLGVWAQVLSKMRWSKGIQVIGDEYLRKVLGGSHEYLAMHIRRGDFAPRWHELTQRHYAHAVWTVLDALKTKHGVHVRHVLVTTDETDQDWLDGLRSYNMRIVDHAALGTLERYSPWFEPVLDSYLLSGGVGFVGGQDSTMSMLPYRRTIDWNHGVGRLITPDYPVPDDWEWEWDLV